MTDYSSITSFIEALETQSSGKWHAEPGQMPWVEPSATVMDFVTAVYAFDKDHPEFDLHNYREILENHSLKWDSEVIESADVSKLDGPVVLALIYGVVRADRFSEGTLKDFIDNGCMCRWLKRLKDLSETGLHT